MRLEFIALDKLAIAGTNMRHGRKMSDVSDLLPTVRARGILQSLLVRPGSEPGTFAIVAGRRRYHAAMIVAGERRAAADAAPTDAGDADPPDTLLPCAILDEGDDADAVEASLIENIARLDTDEVTQWQTFTRLVREGRSVEDIGQTFGMPDLMVRRVLALGNLLPRIRALYGAEKIDRVTVRHLTLASKHQQQGWLALVDDPERRAPTGQQLKAWLFGGQSIPVRHALFDVEASRLAVVADLFGEECWFADPDAFWTAQNTAIEARRAAFVEAGWSGAVIVPPDKHFAVWEHEKTPKRKGGRVYLDVRASGEVVIHEGYRSRREAARDARAGGGGATGDAARPVRPELSGPLQTYVDLHRHAAVRAALLASPGTALRLMVAHAIAGSHLWSVHAEPQHARSDGIAESVETCRGETVFDESRRAVLALLDFSLDAPTVVEGRPEGEGDALARIFWRLIALPDPAVMEVVALVMGESLASGSVAVEAVGLHLAVDMADWWQADPALFELVRDREVMLSLLGDVAGEAVAVANTDEKTKAMKAIVADTLAGANGRDKVERWVPRWMAFPPAAYTTRGGVGTVRAHARAEAAREPARQEADRDAAPAPAPSDQLAA